MHVCGHWSASVLMHEFVWALVSKQERAGEYEEMHAVSDV